MLGDATDGEAAKPASPATLFDAGLIDEVIVLLQYAVKR